MRKRLALFFVAHAINDGFQFAIAPLLPFMARDLSFNYLQVGVLSASMVVSLGVGQLILGLLSDRMRRRKDFVAGGLLILSVSIFLMSRAQSFEELLIFNLLAGVGLATYHPVGTTLITESFPDRGNALGIHGSGGNAGMLFFPFVAGVLTELLTWRKALLILSPAGAIFALLFFFLYSESRSVRGPAPPIHLERLILLILILLCTNMVLRGFVTFYPLLLAEKYSAGFIGLAIALFNGVGIISQLVGGRISGSRRVGTILVAAFLLFPLLIAGLLNVGGMLSQILFLILFGSVLYLVYPVLFLFFSSALPEKSRATGMGVFFSVGIGGSAVSPIIMGSLGETIGLTGSFSFLLAIPLLGAVLTVLYFSSKKK